MGNCFKRQSAATWVNDDEDWAWADAGDCRRRPSDKAAVESGRPEEHDTFLEKGETLQQNTEVKIKINKKQLEKILAEVNGQGLPLHEVLARLMTDAAAVDIEDFNDRARHWRPALQSIPEMAE
ncbi:unnamed protein product [Spirodela intermedia]|uniref:Uncharacterized protein n=2 Tax=Spirodela intermedia TaxID=51605 RepID=A0A7I8IL15_SPIIN|nr:unnamed protein product [Spirodela intermedia]CAA6658216.1 unnamed protein product [Spirodela intermedia]CAA7394402.1 unnamed protein product [Spirodela intermedia]